MGDLMQARANRDQVTRIDPKFRLMALEDLRPTDFEGFATRSLMMMGRNVSD